MSSSFQPRRETSMTEPTSSSAAGVIAWKFLGLSALISAGVLGAVFMAAFDPPKDRKTLFAQGAVAGTTSLIFGPVLVKWFDSVVDFVDLAKATHLEALEVAAPIYLLTGALSWGVFAAIAKLRQIIRDRGAEAAAGKLGL